MSAGSKSNAQALDGSADGWWVMGLVPFGVQLPKQIEGFEHAGYHCRSDR